MNKKLLLLPLIGLTGLACLSGCGGSKKTKGVEFTYEDVTYTEDIGDKTNPESHLYNSIKVKATTNSLRDDFAMGVDGSMIQSVEDNGGVYYNKEGQEQDVFQILKESGVNFFRVRLWNEPKDIITGRLYGGGDNDVRTDIALARRAKAVGMNVLVDFHYSDFWADPDDQQLPKAWGTLNKNEIPAALRQFTVEALQQFKDSGITVDAVQIGNEINNGMCGTYGSIDWNNLESSFDYIADLLKNGISGAKEVFPDLYTMIHLANGGNAAEFSTYFEELDDRNVDYDIIGASYYPYISGNIENLYNNLNNIAKQTGKPVIIAETSWGFTNDSVEGITANQYYGPNYEDVGGYLTSEQAQATCIRDLIDVLSRVENNMGLGIFYWEPAWLPVAGAGWATATGQSYKYTGEDTHRSDYTDGLATWCNQGLFSYTGKALASLDVFKRLKDGSGLTSDDEVSLNARHNSIDVTINLAADETLPTTYPVVTNFDAIRNRPVVWTNDSIEACKDKGTHTARGTVEGKYNVTANVTCIENFVVDPGFENQGETDVVKAPWHLTGVTPSGDKVAKLDRKTDMRSGTTDFNWYHSSAEFTFDLYQDITLDAGTYHLVTYIMAIAPTDKAHTRLEVYVTIGSNTITCDMKNVISGWNDGYHSTDEVVSGGSPVLGNIEVTNSTTIRIGLRGTGVAGAWGHNDDWSLVTVE